MKIIEAKVNVFFNPFNADEGNIQSIIDNLKGKYNLANLDNKNKDSEYIPPEIPRIIGESKNGHTHLNISLNRATIETSFDNYYVEDVEKCINYIKEKSNEIYESLSLKIKPTYLFSGVSITIIFDDLDLDPIQLMRTNFSDLKANTNVYDLSSKFTYVVSENHFVNINIANARGVEQAQGGITRRINHLAVTLDVNDRYGANEKDNYISTYQSLIDSIDITKRLCSEELMKLIKGEELSIT